MNSMVTSMVLCQADLSVYLAVCQEDLSIIVVMLADAESDLRTGPFTVLLG